MTDESNLLAHRFSAVRSQIDQIEDDRYFGRVASVLGLSIEIEGFGKKLSIGDQCALKPPGRNDVMCEIVGFHDKRAVAMPFGTLDGVSLGCTAELKNMGSVIYPDPSWLGRTLNAFGEPVDGKGPLIKGDVAYQIKASPPSAHSRDRVGGKLDLGVRGLNTFLTCCKGQRMGIFAGSGVGKSTLLSMLARYTSSDVNVIGLIGERGRELKEFIEDDLGEEGLKRSVLIASTSDESPLMRRQAAYMTLAIAEYFRDHNLDVLCLMDSVTRFAMAQREIGLSVGEPPASKGYTPTVFSELSRLLERAGPGVPDSEGDVGSITGLFTVLVEGDDHNEPISDAARGILDGHIVLDRKIAERGRYPPVNVLRSVSRTMPDCNTEDEITVISRARELMSTYDDMAEMIRLGAYRKGSDQKIDEAIHYYPLLEDFLSQKKDEMYSFQQGYMELAQILGFISEHDMVENENIEQPGAAT